MPLMNLKVGNKNSFNQIDDLFENYAAVVSGSAFPRHAAIKCLGTMDDLHFYIVDAANKDEQLEELNHAKIKCATILSCGESYLDAKLMALGTTATPSGYAPYPLTKYLIVFTDGRQAIITTRLAEAQLNLERVFF